MNGKLKASAIAAVGAAAILSSALAVRASTPPVDKLAIQLSSANPMTMRLALNNAENVLNYYESHGRRVKVEIVAFGPGLNLLRESTSPFKDQIKALAQRSLGDLRFSACDNTIKKVEKKIGHPVHLLPEAKVVPGGVVRLMALQRSGYAYIDATTK